MFKTVIRMLLEYDLHGITKFRLMHNKLCSWHFGQASFKNMRAEPSSGDVLQAGAPAGAQTDPACS